MPDYTYHPFFKPLLFLLPAESSRRLTLGLLEFQSRTALGRRLFGLFGHGPPPASLAVEAFGLRFPGQVGLGPGIDIEGAAAAVMPLLGFGFLTAGPAGFEAVPRSAATDPRRLAAAWTLARSLQAGAPAAAEIGIRLRSAPDLRVPAGLALRGPRLEEAIASADADFLTVPVADAGTFRRWRAATRRPLLVRLSPDRDAERDADAALEAGLDGCVATAGARTDLLPEGETDGPFLFERSLEAARRVARRGAVVIGAGGITDPDRALAMLDAGAKLVELDAGLVFAGPGLPGRIVHALERRPPVAPPAPRSSGARTVPGVFLVALTGFALATSGILALSLAATTKLLPHDVAYLRMTMAELCARNECRIVHFMAHDRVAFGGSILSIGIIYLWMAFGPLRRGEAWAWWTLLASGATGFASFLTYLGTGYLDVWHGWATLALLPCFSLGLVLSWTGLAAPRGPGVLRRPGARAWLWSPGGQGRALLLFTAAGMILAGAVIMGVGITAVFVPQDLEYMGITAAELRAINPRLVPLIAHDRAGFGGGLCSGGLAILGVAWNGLRPGARDLWWVLLAAGLLGFGAAIGIHPLVGYTSFFHLLPAYIGAAAFLLGLKRLRRPLFCPGPLEAFPDAEAPE
ncbi:MAG TPA: hypothetical protein VF950_25390 [Planctomycetota bacterium]